MLWYKAPCTYRARAIEPTLRPSTFDSYSRNMRNHVIAYIGSVRLTKVDAGTLNGLYADLLASGRRKPSRTGRGYSSDVVARGSSCGRTASRSQRRRNACAPSSTEADHITKDTLASSPPAPAQWQRTGTALTCT